MDDFHVIIDITRGGVIDKAGSLVWWMADLGLFNNGAWWSWKDEWYNKYKKVLDKIPMFKDGARFRQVDLYSNAREDPDIVDILQMIWLDMISDRYTLQKEVCYELKQQIESRLIMNLGLTPEDFIVSDITPSTDTEEIHTEVNQEDLQALTDLLS